MTTPKGAIERAAPARHTDPGGRADAAGGGAPVVDVARAGRPNPAVRAEPRAVGTAGARDPLAREVRLLGALLGQVIAEQEGAAALALVERVRAMTIADRRAVGAAPRAADRGGPGDLERELGRLGAGDLGVLARAFSLFFRLVNLAEEKARVRDLRHRARRARRVPLEDSVLEAVVRLQGRRARTGRDGAPGRGAAHLSRPDGPPDRSPPADGPGRAPARLRAARRAR